MSGGDPGTRPLPAARHHGVRLVAVAVSFALALSGSTAASPRASAGALPAAGDAALIQPSAPRLSAEVVGYLPYWEMTETTIAELDLTKLSSLVLFSVGWDAAGHLRTTLPGYRAITSPMIRSFVERAQRERVRVLVSLTSFGFDKNAAFFSNPEARATLISEAAEFVASEGLDGADIDVEQMDSTHRAAYAATAGSLREELRSRNQDAVVTVATNASVSGARMAASAIAAGVDRAFLMGYNYRSIGSWPGSIDPLVRRSGDPGLSLTASLDLYAQAGVPAGRIILGLPLYGRSWATVDASMGSQRRPGIRGSGASFAIKRLGELRAVGRVVREDMVPVEVSARLVRSVAGVIWQSFYDSPATLRAKLRLVQTRQLAGAGLWALGYSNGRPDYWTAIGDVFGPPRIIGLRVTPSPTNTRAITLAVFWRQGARPVSHIRVAHGLRPFGPWRPFAAAIAMTLPTGPAVSRRLIRVQLRDDANRLSTVVTTTVLYDRAPPRMTGLSITWSPLRRAWVVRYTGRDVGSGVAGYRIVLRRNGVYRILATGRMATWYLLYVPRTAHFRITVRAVDRATNISLPIAASR